jgi:hypothetical protein
MWRLRQVKSDGISPAGINRSSRRRVSRYAAWINRDVLPLIPASFGPGFGLFYLPEELGEAVRNCLRSGGLIVLSQPPPDYGADLFP